MSTSAASDFNGNTNFLHVGGSSVPSLLPERFIFNSTSKKWRRCPCGFLLGSPKDDGKPCTCTAPQIRRYLYRLTGPVLDKIDITIEVHPADAQARLQALPSEDSKTAQARVVATRERQYERGPKLNAN